MCLAWLNFANFFYYSTLFLLLFMGPTALFCTIHGFHCTILTNVYFYLQYFQQKVFSFNFQQNKRIPNRPYVLHLLNFDTANIVLFDTKHLLQFYTCSCKPSILLVSMLLGWNDFRFCFWIIGFLEMKHLNLPIYQSGFWKLKRPNDVWKNGDVEIIANS